MTMGVDYVDTYVVYERGAPVGDVIRELLARGWSLETRDGRITYDLDLRRQYADSEAEAVRDISGDERVMVSLSKAGLEITLDTHAKWTESPAICAWCPLTAIDYSKEFATEAEADEAIARYLDVVRLIVTETNPLYGYGHLENLEPDLIPTPAEATTGDLRRLLWLHLLPLGDGGVPWDQLATAPAWLVERVTPDMALVVLVDNPVQPSRRWKEIQKRVADHLGL